MRAMVAMEEPGGGVRVVVMEVAAATWTREADERFLYAPQRYSLGDMVKTTITVEGYGPVTVYDRPPDWFPGSTPEVESRREIEP